MKYLLDTSAWVRGVLEPDTIPAPVARILSSRTQDFGLSAISVWEVGKKHQRGKLPLPAPLDEWLRIALGNNVEVLPISPKVVSDAMRLPDFPNRDPADELIVATARVHGLTLITSDVQLKGYSHARILHFTPILGGG